MLFLRLIIFIICALAGILAGDTIGSKIYGLLMGMGLGTLTLLLEMAFRRANLSSLITGLLGLCLGLALSALMLVPFKEQAGQHYNMVFLVLSAILGYSGLLAGFQRGKSFTLASINRAIRGGEPDQYPKILDTSVIIDGRIADICETSFIEGDFIAPQFMLHELQHIADSPDSLKRARGRRGLDILQRMQKMHQINVRIVEEDFPKIKEVDAKLVALAKVMGAKVITNDFNLNKVAELQGVTVLNINELANAIKPLVLPGEPLRVFVIKEGKESNQGVAYLEDGTMVVVDNGRRFIGQNKDVTVTSVLQTTAGRMIFTKTKEDYDRDESRQSK